MRNPDEMLELILKVAEEDQRVRGVILNGSRANPGAVADCFQDFDIVYFVSSVDSFLEDRNWIDVFGELMILQTPDLMRNSIPDSFTHFTFLMQFMDGNRIDLTLHSTSAMNGYRHDSLTKILLDKDNLFGVLPEANESDYYPAPPSRKDFSHCCNEFWWVSAYVAKGLWRDQLVYFKHVQDQILRNELTRMTGWYIGIQTGFRCNLGSYGRNIGSLLAPELLELLEATYSGSHREDSWRALLKMCQLFRFTGNAVAEHFQYDYPWKDDERVSAHLRHVRGLPENASSMY